MTDSTRSAWAVNFDDCTLAIEQAVEFWPLVGDVASQERGGSRLVDSSTQRLQISLRRQNGDGDLSAWQLQTAGVSLPLLSETDDNGEIRLI